MCFRWTKIRKSNNKFDFNFFFRFHPIIHKHCALIGLEQRIDNSNSNSKTKTQWLVNGSHFFFSDSLSPALSLVYVQNVMKKKKTKKNLLPRFGLDNLTKILYRRAHDFRLEIQSNMLNSSAIGKFIENFHFYLRHKFTTKPNQIQCIQFKVEKELTN